MWSTSSLTLTTSDLPRMNLALGLLWIPLGFLFIIASVAVLFLTI
jgi:hypothetical protein